jgi:uncharacterized protein (TIRG00374 family)
MKKSHLIGVAVVLLISGFVLYRDLRDTPVQELKKAAVSLNWGWLLFVLLVVLLSFLCEAGILATLAKRPGDPQASAWGFIRIPWIQALFNAITPMSTGGQPSQLVAFVQMGVEGGRATSLLLMKFIIYQVVVLIAYLVAIFSGFSLVMTKFKALAFFIMIGFLIHVTSIAFLLAIMFAYHFTKKTAAAFFRLLRKMFKKQRVDKWEQATMAKIDTFYQEGQKLKKEKGKLLKASALTVLQMLCFYSVPYFVLLALGVPCSWFAVTRMNVLITLFMAIVPIPGASGGAEYSFQTLFSTFIASSSKLVLAMFIWRFATYFFGMILGIFGWSFKPKKIQRIG